jgi:hypothetical protein
MMLAGCSSTNMELRNINQDIPSALVKKYNKSSEPYVDEGKYSNLPFLMLSNEYVAKTESGFQAYESTDWILLLANHTQYSSFDKNGNITQIVIRKYFLASLFSRESYSFSYTEDGAESSYNVKCILGAFGVDKSKSGKKRIKILWIPITTDNPNSI